MESNVMTSYKDTTPAPRLDNKTLNKMVWRSCQLQACFNYERMQNGGVAYTLIPAIKKLYQTKEERAAALKRHLEFFNTHPYVAAPIIGVTLALEEERISKKKAVELFENGVLDALPAGKFSTLQAIHKSLFEDIYDFAGKIREVNIAKGNFRFAPLMYLCSALENIDKMPQSSFDEIIEKYVEMNIAHPFREGNGRATRIWLDLILKKEIGKVVDWSKVDKEDYLLAMERSPIRDLEIKYVLKNALTNKINDREVYMKGIDMSYYYEGYTTFKTEDLK